MTDGVVATSLLSRLERFEMFLGKMFVMLLMELAGGRAVSEGPGEATQGVEGKPRPRAVKAVVAPEAESELALWRMFGEERVRVLPDTTAMLLRY